MSSCSGLRPPASGLDIPPPVPPPFPPVLAQVPMVAAQVAAVAAEFTPFVAHPLPVTLAPLPAQFVAVLPVLPAILPDVAMIAADFPPVVPQLGRAPPVRRLRGRGHGGQGDEAHQGQGSSNLEQPHMSSSVRVHPRDGPPAPVLSR